MKNIAAALLVAQNQIVGVGKDAKNSFANYDYVSAETMITECRRALHKAGLLFCRQNWFMSETGTVKSEYLLSHPDSGEEMLMKNEMVVPPNQKQTDKAVLAALTTGMNYTLRDLLLIPRCENDQPEVDTLPPAVEKRVSNMAAKNIEPEPATGTPALVAAMNLVYGMKDDPRGYEQVLLRHAGEKYGKTFGSAEELPDEYMVKVLDAHQIEYKITKPGDQPDLIGVK